MINIAVIALGHLSNGEITIALETLKHIHNDGFNLLFISHQWGEEYIGSFGVPVKVLPHNDPRDNYKEFLRIINEFKADLLLCADVTTMEYAAVWSGFSFRDLKKLNIPIGSFDQYEWEATDYRFDFMSNQAKNVTPEFFESCDFLIRPCPLNKPAAFDGRIVTGRLFGHNPAPPAMTNSQWRDALGLPPNQKVVFTVNSGWEYIDITRFMELRPLMAWMPRMIYHHLLSVKQPLTVVHVGPKPWDFETHERITYKYFKRMDAILYQETEKQADLFCGTNAISITLSKAAYALTPSVLFQNLKRITFSDLAAVMPKMPAWYRQMAQEVKQSGTFRIFPWGWTRFLEPVFSNNEYNNVFVEAPVFVPPKCSKILTQYLFDQTAIDALKQRQTDYFNSLNLLPPIQEQLRKLKLP